MKRFRFHSCTSEDNRDSILPSEKVFLHIQYVARDINKEGDSCMNILSFNVIYYVSHDCFKYPSSRITYCEDSNATMQGDKKYMTGSRFL